jgi:hypothetical protein
LIFNVNGPLDVEGAIKALYLLLCQTQKAMNEKEKIAK